MKIRTTLEERFKKEAESFDKISEERKRNNQIPDIRSDFANEYFYNNIWRNSKFLREAYGPICNWTIDLLKKAKVTSVMELGCGNGWLSLELARSGFKTTGLDISSKSIQIARGYLNNLENKDDLQLRYVCENILDYNGYSGESVVCFGFLHHLPLETLNDFIKRLSLDMKPGQLLIAVEPRYDHTSYEMAALIYSLRLALPNHFKHEKPSSNMVSDINNIFEDLGETQRTQSEMDGESSSDLILKAVQENFGNADVRYCSSFFEKIIGSIRVEKEDAKILSKLLKQLDDLIVKYNQNFARTIRISAIKA